MPSHRQCDPERPWVSHAETSKPESTATPAPAEPFQKYVRREVHGQRNNAEVGKKIHPSGNGVLLVKVKTAGPVDVHFRSPEVIHRDHDPGQKRLQLPSSRVVA